MSRSSVKILFVSVLVMFVMVFIPTKHSQAQLYTDSITFKIDSVSIEGNELVYSIMFWRPIEDWRGSAGGQQDTVLAHLDLYFRMNDMVFNQGINPNIQRCHPHLNQPNSLLDISCRYHAGRFQIALRTRSSVNSSMLLVPVKYNQPVELCRVRMPLNFSDRNPGFRWDEKATGGKSYTEEPLLKELQGDILLNPTSSLVLKDYFKTGWFCQGGEVKLWGSGYSTGSKQKMTWLMSKDKNMSDAILFDSDLLGALIGEGQVHYGATVNTDHGDLYYQISASNQPNQIRVDTLTIFNVPGWLDSMYFQCILSDETTGITPRKSNEGDIQIYLRDSIFGYFATTLVGNMGDASTTQIGASDRTDTIFKCPTSDSYVSFYFFGPKTGREAYTIGSYLKISYEGMDAYTNPIAPGSVELTSWSEVAGKTAPNGRKLYRGTVKLPKEITDTKVWVTGVSTQKGCGNGGPYVLYDTVFITDMTGDNAAIEAVLSDTTLSGGESMNLNTDYAYTGYYLKKPNNGSLVLNTTPKKYMAPSTVCDNAASCKADTIVYQYNITTDEGSQCTMEVSQVINLADYYYLNLRVLLEAALKYAPTPGEMSSILGGVLPNHSPIDGTELLTTPTPPTGKAVCDWIQVGLRDVNNLNSYCQIVDSVGVLLMTDGSILTTDGDTCLQFKSLPSTSYYVMIMHSSHLRIMSASPVTLSTSRNNIPMWDARVPANVYGNDLKIVDGYGAMYVGDVNQDALINAADMNFIIMSQSSSPQYYPYDLNFDLLINANDKLMVLDNFSKVANY